MESGGSREVHEYATETEARDATQLASSGSIPTNAAPKPHVTAHVWSVQRCATIFRTDLLSNKALRVVLCVACQEDIFRIEDSFLISSADVS